jgi:hypothetical protein
LKSEVEVRKARDYFKKLNHRAHTSKIMILDWVLGERKLFPED